MKPASFFPPVRRNRRRAFQAAVFIWAAWTMPALFGYDCKILPDDVLVSREKGREDAAVGFTLLVRRSAGDTAAFVAPEQLHVRATSGEIVSNAIFTLQRGAAGAAKADGFDRSHAEYRYEGALPSAARGSTLLEIAEPAPFPAARTLISVLAPPREEAVAGTPPPAPAPDPVARNATRKPIVPEIQPNEPVYFVMGGFRGGIHRLDARFQLSLKYRFTELNETWGNFGAAITTTSLWDLHSYSVPFRDSTYRPSVLWMVAPKKIEGHPELGWSADIGIFEHESNGRGPDPDQPLSAANNDSLSRSMNRSYLRPTFTWTNEDWGIFSITPKVFVPFLVSKGNRDIAQYRGYADLLLKWTSQEDRGHLVSLLAREGTRGGHHFVELDYGLPLRVFSRDASGWILFQWLYGYGETLRDYRTRNPGTLRAGLMIVP